MNLNTHAARGGLLSAGADGDEEKPAPRRPDKPGARAATHEPEQGTGRTLHVFGRNRYGAPNVQVERPA
ncbi:MAG: hypothetical protein ACREXP_30905 [Steroidobacteraceae bacterium]